MRARAPRNSCGKVAPSGSELEESIYATGAEVCGASSAGPGDPSADPRGSLEVPLPACRRHGLMSETEPGALRARGLSERPSLRTFGRFSVTRRLWSLHRATRKCGGQNLTTV